MKSITRNHRIDQLIRRVARALATDSTSEVGMTVPYRDAPR